MSISAHQVKELRDKSGVGMMDCKKALIESNGDIDKAFDYLRKSGVAKAQKKEGRSTKEGLVVSHIDSKLGVLLELNCETDFVANTEVFVELGKNIAAHISKSTSNQSDDILEEDFIKDSSKKVKDIITDTIGKLGENIVVSRFCKFELGCSGLMISYIHPGSKLGVILELHCGTDSVANTDDFFTLGKEISMHIAATAPIAVNVEDVSEKVVEKEKEIFLEQAKNSGKPDNIIEKMVDGRIKKFYKENVLLEQTFVKDPSKTIKNLIAEKIGVLGENILIAGFSRYQIGEK